MSEIVFTGTGDLAHDEAVRYRARVFSSMSEAARRTHGTGHAVRKLIERVYTTNLVEPPETVVQRNAWLILGTLYPGLVVSAKSALAARILKPGPDGPAFVFLTGPYRRNVSLPGLEIRVAEGPGPLPGDMPFMGLHLASPARQCLENLMPSRERSGMARTAGRREVEHFLAQRCRTAGEESLNELRDMAREIKDALGASKQYEELNGIVSALLKTRKAGLLTTARGRAIASSEPYDVSCVERLGELFSYLASNPMPRRQDLGAGRAAAVNTAFIEAYFSNYIEGTQFLVAEAEEIVFGGLIPDRRPKDGHDVLATFSQLSDFQGLSRPPKTADELILALKIRHRGLMGPRPEAEPGVLKSVANRAGNTVFVAPREVEGTLRKGFELLEGLSEPFARAVFVHYLVSEVHPFVDGNGRLSRIMMASELEAGGLARAVIPTIYRTDYINGQRAMTRHSDAGANFRMLDRAQSITSMIVEDDRTRCIDLWASTYAFVESDADARFCAPDPSVNVEWRDGIPVPASFRETGERPFL